MQRPQLCSACGDLALCVACDAIKDAPLTVSGGARMFRLLYNMEDVDGEGLSGVRDGVVATTIVACSHTNPDTRSII